MTTTLTPDHRPLVREHLLRLSVEDRRRRFGSPLKDAAITAYAERLDIARTRLIGRIEDDQLVALAEIFPEGDPITCEAAFSVDPGRRRQGLGSAIVAGAVEQAAQDGFGRMVLYIQQSNTPMRQIARRHAFTLRLDEGDYLATRALEPVTAPALAAANALGQPAA